MDEFDEDFGDVDDEEMILAATQVERRISGLSQVSTSPSHGGKRKHSDDDDNIEDDIIDNQPSMPRRRYGGSTLVDGDDFDPAPHPVRSRPTNSSKARQIVAHRTDSTSSTDDGGFGPPRHPTCRDRPAAHKPLTKSDAIKELEDLPSDAFSSSPLHDNKRGGAIFISSSQPLSSQQKRQRLAAPHTGLRQTTLLGGTVSALGPQSQTSKRRNWPLMNTQEPPTHHKLDREAMKTWVYPTNLGTIRDYQFNIVAKGLFHNLLVALPTGLGKTFIAATIMLNWLRWTTESQIVFVAPTKPLVSQQVDACFGIAGIPKSQTAMLTGEMAPAYRAEEWANKRVLFLTPQTLNNDLKTGICDPKKIVCLVVDEAHRATGAYAYVEVVKFIRRFNQSFRVLALTATPGASVEKVQEVIDGLDLARVEIRTEESLDIRNYVHRRKVELIVLEPSDNINLLMDLYAKVLQPLLNRLNQQNAYWVRDPRSLTPYGLMKAQQEWNASNAGRNANQMLKFATMSLFNVLTSLAHPIGLLQCHGIGPFYHHLVTFRSEVEKQGKKGGKTKRQVVDDHNFQELMDKAQVLLSDPTFIGHPKLEYLTGIVLKHFMDAGEGQGASNDVPQSTTRVMVFVHFRDSAEEVVRVLKRHAPMIRPTIFNGQATSKGGSAGMSQKEQLKTISDFQKGIFNTLVATSIGEEGLDIGEINLIVCYDSSASPVRMLQRMGRTGRKRDGNIVLLLMQGKEADSWAKANDNYEKMQEEIASGDKFNYHEEISRRIVPKDIQPLVDKRIIEIPPENSQQVPEPRKRKGRPPKRPPKRFFMPDGVETGFVKASRLRYTDAEDGDGSGPDVHRAAIQEIDDIPGPEEVLLKPREEKDFERRYLNVAGDDLLVRPPKLDAWPEDQRSLSKTRYVKHGRVTRRFVKMLQSMHDVNEERLSQFERNLHSRDKETLLADLESSASEVHSRSPSPEVIRRRPSVPKRSSRLQKTTKERDRRLSSGPHLQCSPGRPSLSGDEIEDSEMDGFIVDDDDDGALELSSNTSSPPPLDFRSKPFYSSPQRNMSRHCSSSEDELPDVLTMVRKEVEVSRDVLAERSSVENLPPITASQRKGKRMIVQDSDDDHD